MTHRTRGDHALAVLKNWESSAKNGMIEEILSSGKKGNAPSKMHGDLGREKQGFLRSWLAWVALLAYFRSIDGLVPQEFPVLSQLYMTIYLIAVLYLNFDV